MKKIAWSIFVDNVSSRILIAYLLLLTLMLWTAVIMEDSASKASVTILNLVLLVVPLMSLLYTTIYLYNSREYIVLLLAQPLRRGQLWSSLYVGIVGSLSAMFLLGATVPLFLYTDMSAAIAIILIGIASTMIFSSVGMLVVAYVDDKAKGIGLTILVWILLTMIYDALCLYALFMFGQWPIEKPIMWLLMLNPQDLARFLVILRTDASAMMGYSGAAFRQFLGQTLGMAVAVALLVLWVAVPYLLSLQKFRKKDL